MNEMQYSEMVVFGYKNAKNSYFYNVNTKYAPETL